MRYQRGRYFCNKCDRSWGPDTLQFFLKAFDMGRAFERKINE